MVVECASCMGKRVPWFVYFVKHTQLCPMCFSSFGDESTSCEGKEASSDSQVCVMYMSAGGSLTIW